MSALPSLPTIAARGNPCRDQGCSACCHDTEMLLTEADVARMRAATGRDDFYFRADDGFLQLLTREGKPAAGSRAPHGAQPAPCVFLRGDGACAIHDARPEGCRLYPAVWDAELRAAALDREHCPFTADFQLTSATGDAVRRLADRLEAERQTRLRSG